MRLPESSGRTLRRIIRIRGNAAGKTIRIKTSPLVILLLAVLVILFFHEGISPDRIFAYRDLSRYFYPLRLFTVRAIESGTIPLWNPYVFSGFPHFASLQSAAFYPLSLIYYIFPFDIGFNYFLIFHIFLGGLFVYLLAKEWGYCVPASLVSCITFMFSGFTISVVNMPTTLCSMAWVPLAFLFFQKAMDRGGRYTVLSGAVLAIMFLGGEPSIYYFTVLGLLLYSATFIFRKGDPRPALRQSVAAHTRTFAGMVTLSLLLPAFQLIPFVELLTRSDRPFVLPEFTSAWSLSLRDTANFIIPYFFGADFSKDAMWKTQVWAPVIYIGTFTLLLVVMALVLKKDRTTRFLIFLGAFFLALSYGRYTPFYGFASRVIPGLSLIRYPVRFLFMVNFCLAMASGAGYGAFVDGLETADETAKRFFKALVPVLALAGVLFLVLYLFPDRMISAASSFFAREQDAHAAFVTAAADLLNVRRCLGLFVAGSLLLAAAAGAAINRAVAHFAFVALIAIDFFSATSGLQLTSDRELFHRTNPTIEFLKKDPGLFRFYTSPTVRRENSFVKSDENDYGRFLQEAKEGLCANRMMEYGLYDARGYESMRLMNYAKLEHLIDSMGLPACAKLLDLLNVKYVLTTRAVSREGFTLVAQGRFYLYENKNVLPRAFLVPKSIVLTHEKEIAEALKSGTFAPSQEVILEEPAPKADGRRPPSGRLRFASHSALRGPLRGGSASLRTPGSAESARIVRYRPREVIVDVAADSPKFLVLGDQYYPGWKAFVDGKRSRLYKADFVLRAVYIDAPGRHTVRFVFDPFSFKAGLAVSLVTLAAVLGMALAHRVRRGLDTR